MRFPLLPLIGVLSGFREIDFGISFVVVGLALIVGVVLLGMYAGALDKCENLDARNGFLALGIAVFVSVVGVVYIVTALAAFAVLYLLFYQVLWRYLIKNIVVACKRGSKEEKK